MEETKEKVEGLGGWLITPILGLIYSAFFLIKSLYQDHLSIYQGGVWEILANPASNAYHNLWAPMLILMLNKVPLCML